MVDEIMDQSTDPYSAQQIADLSTGVLAELKKLVDAEVARRIEDCKALMPQPKKRAPRGTKKKEK